MGDPNILNSPPEDVLSTLHADGRRRWMYPVPEKGRWWKRRFVVAWALILIFLAFPIVKIGGKPAIFLDLAHREFTFFGLTLYPTDTFLLTLFLLSGFVFILLFTTVAGRVWCGWACPQTVYMEFLYRPIERLIEGKETARRRRDEGPSSFDRTWRKALKLAIFLVISAVLAHTFVAYFVSWDALIHWMTGPPTEHWGYFVMMAMTTGLVLFNFGYFREQMCTIACPYARIQSVLLDQDSLIVSYDKGRGEKRGKRNKKTAEVSGLGDCVDCGACVRTCPTGIDIRDGLQMECITCTQCIDACDAIMIQVGKPVGLIRYTSENALEDKQAKLLRPRSILYVVVLTVVSASFMWALSHRTPVDVNIGRVVGAPFTMLVKEKVMNRVRFRVQNRSGHDATFSVAISEPEHSELKMIGPATFMVKNGHSERVEAFVIVPEDEFHHGRVNASFNISNDKGDSEVAGFTLIGP